MENRDEDTIRSLFSPYALENTDDLDEKIKELIDYYPGIDEEYEGVADYAKDADYGKIQQVVDVILITMHDGKECRICICLQMQNDYDPSKEGVHFIEMIREEDHYEGFKWKNKEDSPGIYLGK